MATSIKYQNYVVHINDNGIVTISKDGVLFRNQAGGSRELASVLNLDVEPDCRRKKLNRLIVQEIARLNGTQVPELNDNDEDDAAETAPAATVNTTKDDEKKREKKENKAAAVQETKKEAKKEEKVTAKTNNNAGALKGVFSVAENQKIHFSMGNLQFNPKKYEFRFAEHQWDRIGEDNSKIAPNCDGWIDLFGYGTSGYMGCEPTETDCESKRYPGMDIANTKYDWGVYNPISNGGNKEGLWRTLTKNEWLYLLNKRPNAAKLRAKACVNGIYGAIFLPDDFYEHRVRVPFDSTPNGFSGNTYNLEQWTLLADAGAVFLPCVGYRKGTKVEADDSGRYWTSTGYNSITCYIYFFDYSLSESFFGRAVRLVQDIK